MNPDEAMQEIAECSYHGTLDGVCNLGELWYEGEPSDANSHWVLESRCVEPETARRYLIGFLQEWFVRIDKERPCAISMYDPALCAHNHKGFLGALWTT